ncbi:MAG TPA: hypothetical protein VFZ59_15900 [Verrucomicrobiae bacterium]|nr:hypothetical protein [Verrucomicrobiae bacterium]
MAIPKKNQVERFTPNHLAGGTIDQVGGELLLKDRTVFGFYDGRVTLYGGPGRYFGLADVRDIPNYFGAVNMTKPQAIELARATIRKLGYSLEDVLANLEPEIPPLQTSNYSTNVIPRYRIQWMDPRSGMVTTRVEVNAEKKRVEAIRFSGIVALKRPGPKLNVKPAPLDPTHPLQQLWIRQNELGQITDREYAYRLVPHVFQAVEEWVRKLNLDLPLPITTNHVKRFYCETIGGVPYVQLCLTNDWEFVYRMNGVTYFGSPRRFFDSDKLPFRVRSYAGERKLTDEQAIELARQTVSKLDYSTNVHINAEPRIWHPKNIKGLPTIPRVEIEWIYPNPQEPRSEWIRVEVDCEKGKVEMLQFDVVKLWDKPLDLGVPLENPKVAPSK